MQRRRLTDLWLVIPPSRRSVGSSRAWRVCCVGDSRGQTGVGAPVCVDAHRLRGGANDPAGYDPDINHRPFHLRNLGGIVHRSGGATGGRYPGCSRIPGSGWCGRAHCGSPAPRGYDLQRADGVVAAPGATDRPSHLCLDPNTSAAASPSAGAERARIQRAAQSAGCADSGRNCDPRRRFKPGPDDGRSPIGVGRRPDSRSPATSAGCGTTDSVTEPLSTI